MKKVFRDEDDDDSMYSCEEDSDHFMNDKQMREMMSLRSRRKSVSAEGYDPDDDRDDDDVKVVHPKSDEQRRRLSSVISKMLMFKGLDQVQINAVLDAMFERKVEAGEHVIDEGNDGDNFYVIDRGNYDIYIKDPVTKNQVKKGSYTGAGAFGELALMYNCPRSATIVATTDGLLWAMDRMTFRRIIVKNNARKRKKYEDFLATVPLLQTLRADEIAKVADAMSTVTYRKGDHILDQGGRADYFYIILEGQVVISKKSTTDPRADPIQLNRYGPGQYFGELALITNQPRAATAIADGPCTCAVLDVQAFERLLGPCKELLMRNIPMYEQQLSSIYGQLNIGK